MNQVSPLPPDRLLTRCDPSALDFETTRNTDDLARIVGQDRAVEALDFGVRIRHKGYHVFALGPRETDKERYVRRILEEHAHDESPPPDWCYVHNFEEPHRPRALSLPAGRSLELQADMERFTDQMQSGLTAAFESEEYQTRRHALETELQQEHEAALTTLQEHAEEKGFTLLRTPAGFIFAPLREGEVLSPQGLQQLSEEERKRLESEVEKLQQELLQILRQVPQIQRNLHRQLRALNQEVARFTVRDMIDELREKYQAFPQVTDYLGAVENDIVENVRRLIQQPSGEVLVHQLLQSEPSSERYTRERYHINPIISKKGTDGAPVIYEENPSLPNLVGRIDYRSQIGTLVTDFTLLKPGALHRANGGYLMLELRKVLLKPFAWEVLKRTLRSGEIKMQTPYEEAGLLTTTSLDPAPIPLDVKVVLLGDRLLYYLLHGADPEVAELFKIEADFEEDVDRTDASHRLYARLIGTMARREGLRPLDAPAVARIIEHCSRMAEDAEKLSAATSHIRDLLCEADVWAAQTGHDVTRREDVVQALEARRRRGGRLRERIQESMVRETLFVDTTGTATGQINGLSVIQLSRHRFGRPSRITANVHMGRGDVIDIEREVELGGPIHSKGVLILTSFLAARYASDQPLSLSASLVFEQSYGGVEGDSASSAELYALLSAIAEVPLRQSLAVTGSVNQHGKIQPIGGVNEKIEGFFELCDRRGLTGDQGVLIPASNVKNLMLREEVVQAARADRFHVYPVETINQGMHLLTGHPMGERQPDGAYPEDTINARIGKRLQELAEKRAAYLSTNGERRADEPKPQ